MNVPLLAACLQLCKAFDLKSPTTILQIISHMPEGNRISPGKLEAYFKAADAGAHPYLNGTIRLEIQADGYTESWQQLVLKSFAKKSS